MQKHSPGKVVPILMALVLILAGVLASYPMTSAAEDTVVIPDDESPHPSVPTEWWYFTGHLNGVDIFGRHHQYGFLVNIARTDAAAMEPVACIYAGQFAISDITRGEFKMTELNFGIQPDVVPAGGGFNNTVGTLHMDGKNGVNHVYCGGFADLSYTSLNLNLSQTIPPALHYNTGYMPYGPFGVSGYYSETRLNVTGSLIDHGLPVCVTGIAWQDHQWGNWTSGTGGWEWFSIQLANNTQYMLYFIHDANYQIVQKVGTLVNADGTTTNLDPASISYTALGSWTSPHTGNTYQQGWTVNIPGGTLTVTPQMTDQEVWNPLISMMNFWEGTCTVSGTINGSPVTGQAYQEQTLMMTMQGSGALWDQLLSYLGL